MLAKYHTEITSNALKSSFSPKALQTVIEANIGQDKLINLIIHPEYHFDNNLFTEAYAYLDQQKEIMLTTLNNGNQQATREAFGRIIHGVQDFYAHSNYVEIWLEMNNGKDKDINTIMQRIEPLDEGILNDPGLHTSRVYYFRDAISYIPGIRNFVMKISPPDSHSHMNLDAPESNNLFPYAFAAAEKRTVHEFKEIRHLILSKFGPVELGKFTGDQPIRIYQDPI